MKIKAIVAFFQIAFLLTSCRSSMQINPTEKPLIDNVPIQETSAASEVPNTSIALAYLNEWRKPENTIVITNTGENTARNVRLWVCALHSNNPLKNINSINSYFFGSDNPSANTTKQYNNNVGCLPDDNGSKLPNGIFFELDSLESGESLRIRIHALPNVKFQPEKQAGTVYTLVPTNLDFGETVNDVNYHLGDPLVNYFTNKTAISDWYIRAECDNCTDPYINQAGYGFVPYFKYRFSDFKILSDDDSFMKTSFGFEIEYYALEGTGVAPETESLYLKAVQGLVTQNINLEKVSKEQFWNVVP